jgi:uncharacterized protein (DUF486 family)
VHCRRSLVVFAAALRGLQRRVVGMSTIGLRGAGCRRHRSAVPTDALPVLARAAGLLVLSNVFMTFAWYAHLKDMGHKPWLVAALLSWGIALFEYLLQVPANRIGYTALTLPQLKILQEVITLTVFVPFAVFYMKQPLKWDFLWAALCILGAVYFIFRGGMKPVASA